MKRREAPPLKPPLHCAKCGEILGLGPFPAAEPHADGWHVHSIFVSYRIPPAATMVAIKLLIPNVAIHKIHVAQDRMAYCFLVSSPDLDVVAKGEEGAFYLPTFHLEVTEDQLKWCMRNADLHAEEPATIIAKYNDAPCIILQSIINRKGLIKYREEEACPYCNNKHPHVPGGIHCRRKD